MTGLAIDPVAAACTVLRAAAPEAKCAAAENALAALAGSGPVTQFEASRPPARPARPDRPKLAPPGTMPRRRLGSPAGRVALLHAVAHIEFNAIDLAFDMATRFAPAIREARLDADAFFRDWVALGAEEARHFAMIADRLAEYGSAYGALPAHDGLWEAADRTAGDVAARLAVAPLILEARGLDVTPDMARRLRAAGDTGSADCLETIYREEIGHVACGKRWFDAVCAAQGEAPAKVFPRLQQEFFPAGLKGPFNVEARRAAGLEPALYDRGTAGVGD
ncbi:MAG: ferritin-like domain-containing protein [Pseudomonadota bacterium]